jgi:hypothetical protein
MELKRTNAPFLLFLAVAALLAILPGHEDLGVGIALLLGAA